MPEPRPPASVSSGWQAATSASVRSFHRYAGWLVSISWKRFFLLSALLLIASGILQNLPPFRWTYTETISERERPPPLPPRPDPAARSGKGKDRLDGLDISIDQHGVRIRPKAPAAAASAGAAVPSGAVPSAAASGAGASGAAEAASSTAGSGPSIEIRLPPGSTSETVRHAVDEARQAIEEAVREARQEAVEAAREAAQEAREAARATADGGVEMRAPGVRTRTRQVHYGDALPELAFLWIIGSAIIKVTYKRQIQAEAQAAQAVETAEAESLKRQVVEARMAAMQAQVEPHFLFNTLASIDHLIEVDPQRASAMQKNLIALLRASMPTMREAGDGGPRDLGRELSVIRPYLEILKVRMEERLSTQIDVPDGLLSAEFPQMMLQTLVENAVKHGLEPKPEGGHLKVKAEIVHGKLAVSVADSGLGFGRSATAGTGVGLANIRERLQLLYGGKAALTIAENPGGGTVATISVPYRPLQEQHA